MSHDNYKHDLTLKQWQEFRWMQKKASENWDQHAPIDKSETVFLPRTFYCITFILTKWRSITGLSRERHKFGRREWNARLSQKPHTIWKNFKNFDVATWCRTDWSRSLFELCLNYKTVLWTRAVILRSMCTVFIITCIMTLAKCPYNLSNVPGFPALLQRNCG